MLTIRLNALERAVYIGGMSRSDRDDDDSRRKRRLDTTSTGHRAGIHSAEEFGKAEKNLRHERDTKLNELNALNKGQNEGTIYRDKHGRKLDMLNEFVKQQEVLEGKRSKIEQAQQQWGQGASEKMKREDRLQELADIAAEPFARTIDDPQLERKRKSELRTGDPMAEYFHRKRDKEQLDPVLGIKTSRTGKPLYSGPNPTPNRFGLKPGYRWDAVDRSNSFEHKVLTKINETSAFKEDEYKYSVSDL